MEVFLLVLPRGDAKLYGRLVTDFEWYRDDVNGVVMTVLDCILVDDLVLFLFRS
jgi:hypothetical protein|tara:strand:+ start:818 stop:979 length:162 start_codon:yes stop_codon:yes gene_type:complete